MSRKQSHQINGWVCRLVNTARVPATCARVRRLSANEALPYRKGELILIMSKTETQNEASLFKLGRVVVTAGVQGLLDKHELINARAMFLKRRMGWRGHVNTLLACHQSGDWGDVCPEDAHWNDKAVEDGDRVLSSYKLYGEKVWVITEADRSVTTILFPSEY